ncbi:hypothetical protein BGZ94_005998 [Podila epigama]|nr:hypothetical protein BGZ94_005998 [Podila epigama]
MSEEDALPLYATDDAGDHESLDDAEFDALARRLADAIDALNQASIVVYQMLGIIVWDELLRDMDDTAGDGGIELESEIEDVTLSGGKATVEGMEGQIVSWYSGSSIDEGN